MKDPQKPLEVRFYKTSAENEPVRVWLKRLAKEEKKVIGENIKTLQFGWPIGMPLARALGDGLWEIRSNLKDKTARILFTVHKDRIILLHGFMKKERKTPQKDIELARKRMCGGKEKYKRGGD